MKKTTIRLKSDDQIKFKGNWCTVYSVYKHEDDASYYVIALVDGDVLTTGADYEWESRRLLRTARIYSNGDIE